MSETNFRALCAALVDEAPYESPTTCLARAALAQPEPVAPTDEELDELKDDYWWFDANHSKPWIPFARTVFERYGNHTREEN